MYQRRASKNLLYTFVFLAFSLMLVAIFSLYFSNQTIAVKKQELLLQKKYRELQKKIAQKEKEYRKISDNIQELHDNIGLNQNQKQNIRAILKKCTPNIRKMVLQNIPHGYPSSTRRITSSFGYRIHPIFHEERFHHGIDFGGKEGTPIRATCDGIVEFAGYSKGGYGNLVLLQHNYGFKTLYGHMLQNLRVQKGDFVKKGQIIGYLGNSGLSTGPHLHYEIKYLRSFVDPKYFLKANQRNFATLLKNNTAIIWQPLISAITSSYQKFTSL